MSAADNELIVVALSGGVDSATAAALLCEQGARVVGIAMRLHDGYDGAEAAGRCCSPHDLEDARRVCAHLGVPFYVANYTDEFRRQVIDDFVVEYRRGRTPNPCVRCNERLKFAALLRRARALGAGALATGHYARIAREGDAHVLRRGADQRRDQSYFLFTLGQVELGYLRFPLGDLTKAEVRAHARRLGLPVADKPESHEVCFVPDGDCAGFVARQGGAPPAGDIVDGCGRVVGRHRGIHCYTVGQRQGLGVALGEPYYVTAIEPGHNRVRIGPATELGRTRVTVAEMRWSPAAPGGPFRAGVQIRYRHAPAGAVVTPQGDCAEVRFDEPERAVAPGQAAVVYEGDRVLGGGFIASAAP